MAEQDKSFIEALRENIEKIDGSAVFLQLYHPSMAEFENDPWPAIQLAIAILLDKPILIACPIGREPPEKLRRVADIVVHGGPEEYAKALQQLIDKVNHAPK